MYLGYVCLHVVNLVCHLLTRLVDWLLIKWHTCFESGIFRFIRVGYNMILNAIWC